MANASLPTMPPPQAPAAPPLIEPAQLNNNLQSQTMVVPQYSHNSSGYPQGLPSSIVNGTSGPAVGHGMQQNQTFPQNGSINNSSQCLPNNGVNIFKITSLLPVVIVNF